MAAIRSFFQDIIYALPKIGIMDILDILVVAFIIYTVLRFIRSTSSARVAIAILALLVVTWITDIAHMYALNWILGRILEMGVIALVIVFQPELRRALEKVGSRFFINLVNAPSNRSRAAGMCCG